MSGMQPCPPAVRCADQDLCPPTCQSAGNREGNRKRCYWCGDPATGTALAGLYEDGRLVSRLGGRFASCGDHGLGFYATTPAPTPTSAAPTAADSEAAAAVERQAE